MQDLHDVTLDDRESRRSEMLAFNVHPSLAHGSLSVALLLDVLPDDSIDHRCAAFSVVEYFDVCAILVVRNLKT